MTTYKRASVCRCGCVSGGESVWALVCTFGCVMAGWLWRQVCETCARMCVHVCEHLSVNYNIEGYLCVSGHVWV